MVDTGAQYSVLNQKFGLMSKKTSLVQGLGLGLQAVGLYFSCFWCLPPAVKSQLIGKDPDVGKV